MALAVLTVKLGWRAPMAQDVAPEVPVAVVRRVARPVTHRGSGRDEGRLDLDAQPEPGSPELAGDTTGSIPVEPALIRRRVMPLGIGHVARAAEAASAGAGARCETGSSRNPQPKEAASEIRNPVAFWGGVSVEAN